MKKKEIKNILINNFKKIYENGDCYIGQYLMVKLYMKANLSMTKKKEKENIFMKMEIITQVIG